MVFPRYVAVLGLMLITLGGASLLFHAGGGRYLISTSWGFLMLSVGVCLLLYHSFNETDFQFRRLYGVFGFVLLAIGLFLRLVPLGEGPDKRMGGGFMPYGGFGIVVALGFLLSFVKNESETGLRQLALNLIGFFAAANGLAGFILAMISERLFGQTGVIHLILGLLYAVGYVSMEGINSQRGFWAGRAIGILEALMFLVALVRSLWPVLWSKLNWSGDPPSPFFLPTGLLLMYIGIEYLTVYLGVCSDSRVIVLTRRELGAFFFSPIAYIVMIGMVIVGWLNFVVFVSQLFESPAPIPEPIFFSFTASFLALIPLIFLVPIITMRMLSEERRSGTLEVLLSAPVNEWHVVLAKFLAGMRVFMLCWYLWGVFFIALWVEGDREFDYRPIVTFWIALVCMGASFVAMGLFFSSVTRHQILAAVLTFVMMMGLTLLFMINRFVGDLPWLSTLITYVSYIDLWISAGRSTITPRLLLLNLSVAAFWLYLSIKVLEARKWS